MFRWNLEKYHRLNMKYRINLESNLSLYSFKILALQFFSCDERLRSAFLLPDVSILHGVGGKKRGA